MREFQVDGRTISAYLAVPEQDSGPGVLILHAWWGLTEPFQQVCDRLAEAGFVALAPDLYHGKTTTSVEEAHALSEALDQDVERWRGDIAGAMQVLRQHSATHQADSSSKLALVGFSLGGAYALDMSVTLAEEIAAVVTFYDSYPGLDYRSAKAAYLCHFAEDDPFRPVESAAEMEQELQAAGRPVAVFTYPGTKHWFFEENRPEYNAQATQLSWERTIEFLHQRLD
ncbi:dienelactone hydrolase family protein [Ktedonobacter robiniae]|uniref:Dienelactone hydrolase n=1 Tax=Ktedonobacter robiniae TaxID=2778365 RepID=A0ABQ3UK74_9CHLR|nr:dienelactone hydrolase family protein [Ktedonobacter robiniae]GHO53094.1 dienelactone hydrolase [Ktedonobacter robiniae]